MSSVKNDATEIGRRHALKLLAAVMAAPLVACSPPDEEIIPYADMPEGQVAGEPMRFATSLPLSGYGRGFVGISIDGRPIKIEGNPRHPFSLGATDLFAEATVLSLYDLDRSRHVRSKTGPASWDDFNVAWSKAADSSGASMALVTGRVIAPAALDRIAALKKRFPGLRWYRYEPIHDDAAREGARRAFGKVVTPLIRWGDADVILSLDVDPLGPGPDQLRIARAYAARREGHRQRLHVAEPCWTATGAAADRRLAIGPQMIGEIARVIAVKLGADIGNAALPSSAREFAERAGDELVAAQGRAMILPGPGQSAELHALCHWINEQLKAPITYLADADPIESDHAQNIEALARDLDQHRIEQLFIVDANPVYDAPDILGLAEAIKAVPFSAHLGLYHDETAACCTWHLPQSHALESWGDERALDGTVSLVQPLIGRLHDTKTRDEFLGVLSGDPGSAYDLLRGTWQSRIANDFEAWWRFALHDGVVAGGIATPLTPLFKGQPVLSNPSKAPDFTLALKPDATLWDGRFANNAWLQECPKPFTKEVWGNALTIAPVDADRLGIGDGDAIEFTIDGATVDGAAVIMTGQAEGVVGTSWGHGRTAAGRIGNSVGTRYGGLGARPSMGLLTIAHIGKSKRDAVFRSTQAHTRLAGSAQELFPVTTAAALSRPQQQPAKAPASFLAPPARGDYAWGMVVDTDACIGCNACVVACQAENNVPIVGPDEIARGRDMHWLRVDSYVQGNDNAAQRGFQPVPCMHCELAPCEPVCPVAASVHDHEGLNVQVYNRCIGTRFCEANCPYKVRRFNYFAYADEQAFAEQGPALKAQHNPDVSSRSRGVMEKCNYCLQRISRARRTSEKEGRPIAEGEVTTACQSACPTRAIHFGDLNRADSDVSKLRHAPQHYVLLEQLNTRPRTSYLKRVYNDDNES